MSEQDLRLGLDFRTLRDFQEHTPDFLHQLKETGEPVVLTIDDQPELVVQNAASHQKLLDLVEAARVDQAVRQGLADRDAGRTISLEAFKDHARRQHGISI